MPDHPRVLLVLKGLDLGGLERMVVDLALVLGPGWAEVAVINDRRDQLAGELERAGVRLHRLGGTDLIGAGAARRLVRLARKGGFDVVHVHGPLPAVVTRFAARRNRPPVVTTSHTPFASLHPLTRALWVLTARRDAAVVAVSAAVASSLPRTSRNRARVIPHGVDQQRIDQLTVRPPDGSDPVHLVTVASHREAKNYPNLLHAVRRVNETVPVHLTAIGQGPRFAEHRDLAHRLGLADAVTFEPPTHDVLARIAAADVLVVASDYEGQPLVVAEALALGRPVVATAVGRVPELVTPSVGRVVPPGDPEALAAALTELAADPDLRRRLGDAAHDVPHWNLDDVLDAHLVLYRSLR